MKSKKAKITKGSILKSENHCPVPSSLLLIIGGKENKGQAQPDNKKKHGDFIKLEVLERFKKIISKRDPIVEVITTSSGEAADSFKEYKKVFSKLGISKVGQIHHNIRKDALDNPYLERLKKAD